MNLFSKKTTKFFSLFICFTLSVFYSFAEDGIAGYKFISDNGFSLQFFKYWNDGKNVDFKGYKNVCEASENTYQFSPDGTLSMDIKFSDDDGFSFYSQKYTYHYIGKLDGDVLTISDDEETLIYKRESLVNNELEFISSDENKLNYKDLLILALNKCYSPKNAINEYIRIFHNDELVKCGSDEFAKQDLLDACTKEFNEYFSKIRTEFVYTFKWNFGDYNFDKGGFPVSFVKDNNVLTVWENKVTWNELDGTEGIDFAYLEQKCNEIYAPVAVATMSAWSVNPISFMIQMDRNKAREFLSTRNNDRTVIAKVYSKLSDYIYRQDKPGEGIAEELPLKFWKVEIYDNENDMNLLYSGSVK